MAEEGKNFLRQNTVGRSKAVQTRGRPIMRLYKTNEDEGNDEWRD